MFGIQVTGNSNSIRAFWKPLREAGAAARLMLVQAAAQQWQVDPATCSTADGDRPSRTDWPLRSHTAIWCDAAAALPVPRRSAAQGPERFHADRQAAQALRHSR